MWETFGEIGRFVWESLTHIWPYLLVTIPFAVAVQMSGASKYIKRAFQASPVVAIFLATAVGAFSPFCSCSVIPVVAALLIGGVPLAPVMAFWVASPSMDPEIFFLSVGILGWELAIWRLASTLLLSLSAGFITHVAYQRGWLGQRILRQAYNTRPKSRRQVLVNIWDSVKGRLNPQPAPALALTATASGGPISHGSNPSGGCSSDSCSLADEAVATNDPVDGRSGSNGVQEETAGSFRHRLLRETWSATTMVVKFMALAFLLEALIILYVPEEWITGLLGPENLFAIPTAALLGVPVYTSNLSALPLIGGLLEGGMNPAAALAFLVAGPTTTLPAMAAVWGLAARRVFVLYVTFSLVGAVFFGWAYSLIS